MQINNLGQNAVALASYFLMFGIASAALIGRELLDIGTG
jgi:hypothetical protein